jgi:hypothetical protein
MYILQSVLDPPGNRFLNYLETIHFVPKRDLDIDSFKLRIVVNKSKHILINSWTYSSEKHPSLIQNLAHVTMVSKCDWGLFAKMMHT